MEELVSVIVPVLDVDSYLTTSIESIIKQSYTNIEIILVCRENNRNCKKICEYYEKQDKRVKLYEVKIDSTKNFKNVGLSKAKGKYVTFVDGGDTVSKDYVDYMYDLIKKEKADIVCARRYTRGNKQKRVAYYDTYEGGDIIKNYVNMKFRSHFYAKLYKKDLFNDIEYPEIPYNDDFMIGYKIFDKAKRLVNSTLEIYLYNPKKRDIYYGIQDYDQMKRMGSCFDLLTYVEEKYPELSNDCKAKICLEALDLFEYVQDKDYRKQLYSYISLFRKYALRNDNVSLHDRVRCSRSILGCWFLKFSIGLERFIKKPID